MMPTVEHRLSFDYEWFGRIKAHIHRHRGVYCFGAGVAVTSFAFGFMTGIRRPMIAPVFNNVISNTVNNGGHMRKIVRCVETGQMWLSVTDTAKTLGKSISVVSQHLNHPELSPDINGLHYVIEALASN